MTKPSSLLRLMAWLSPVFPTGGFSYSSGLETAVQTGRVTNEHQLGEWLTSILKYGSLHNDAIVLVQAWRNYKDASRVLHINDLMLALAGSAERHLETTAQGVAFAKAIRSWPETTDLLIPDQCTLPVAIGIAAAGSNLNLHETLVAYLQSSVTNQLQAAIRLSIIGQTAAASLLAQLEPVILETSAVAEASSLNDLGSSAVIADIMAMKHEELPGRMFRS